MINELKVKYEFLQLLKSRSLTETAITLATEQLQRSVHEKNIAKNELQHDRRMENIG